MQVYDSDDNGWVVVGGTSEATPLIAAYYALLDAALASAPQGPSWAYANASLLNDPSTGSNGSCAASMPSSATPGPATTARPASAASPARSRTEAPGIAGPGTNGTYAPSMTAQSAQLQGGVYPNGEDTDVLLGVRHDHRLWPADPTTDIGSGTAPVPVTDSLTGLSAGMTYHYRLVAQNGLGTSTATTTR